MLQKSVHFHGIAGGRVVHSWKGWSSLFGGSESGFAVIKKNPPSTRKVSRSFAAETEEAGGTWGEKWVGSSFMESLAFALGFGVGPARDSGDSGADQLKSWQGLVGLGV